MESLSACSRSGFSAAAVRQVAPGRPERLSLHAKARAISLRVTCSQSAEPEAAPAPAAATSPFAGKKISSLLAARKKQAPDSPGTATPESSAPPPPAPQPEVSGATSLSPTIAALLKDSPAKLPAAPKAPSKPVAVPASPFASGARTASVNAVPAGTVRPKLSFGKRNIIDALKAEDSAKPSAAAKVGQREAPANIFVDPVRTKEQIEAEKFRFEINQGQVLLVLSFFASSLIMLGTVYVVWKLRAIHYNEF